MNECVGTPAHGQDLIDVDALIFAYYDVEPDPADPFQAVVFGAFGHRGSSFDGAFNEVHIAATTQVIVEYRKAQGYDGPLFIGRDTHGLSAPAERIAIEVLATNNVDVRVDSRGSWTPTPSVSLAILRVNGAEAIAGMRQTGSSLADGTVITPSYNPPRDGGFKYNPPTGGLADTDATKVIAARTNELLREGWKNIARIPYERAKGSMRGHEYFDQYIDTFAAMIDLAATRKVGMRIGADPMGGASAEYWGVIGECYGLDLTMANPVVDPKWSFMAFNWDGKIRMDCPSLNAMVSLWARMTSGPDGETPFDVATGNDADSDRHGIVTPDGDFMNPNHYLAAAIGYPFMHHSGWREGTAVGKTLVFSSFIDRVVAGIGKKLIEVPVGLKRFAPGPLTGDVEFGGEESAGGSFLRTDGAVWTTGKDGLIMDLFASEIIVVTGKSPSQLYAEQAKRYGDSAYTRVDASAAKTQKARLAAFSSEDVAASELTGESIAVKLVRALGSDAPIGGLKVTTESSWLVARPSGTENVYKIYAKPFKKAEHLAEVQEAARAVVLATFGA